MHPDYVGMLLEFDPPEALPEKRAELQASSAWRELMWDLGTWAGSDAQSRWSLDAYSASAGPGARFSSLPRIGSWELFDATHGLVSGFVTTLLEDPSGTIWAGTYGGGIACLEGHRFRAFTTREGLVHNEV
jgi:hypothetical protein